MHPSHARLFRNARHFNNLRIFLFRTTPLYNSFAINGLCKYYSSKQFRIRSLRKIEGEGEELRFQNQTPVASKDSAVTPSCSSLAIGARSSGGDPDPVGTNHQPLATAFIFLLQSGVGHGTAHAVPEDLGRAPRR